MLSKRQIKYFKSLQLKKYRLQERKFLVEGAKGILEVLQSGFKVAYLIGTEGFLSTIGTDKKSEAEEVLVCKEIDLASVGTFKTNNTGIAIVHMPEMDEVEFPKNELSIALDNVRDPGNLGTIIRIADWYGVKQIFCTHETADYFNPKVINSTMGSFTRVSVYYTDLVSKLLETDLPVYGALLEGVSIYQSDLSSEGIVLMGNESNGICDELKKLVTHPVHIPGRGGAESLNVSVATAVILDNFFR